MANSLEILTSDPHIMAGVTSVVDSVVDEVDRVDREAEEELPTTEETLATTTTGIPRIKSMSLSLILPLMSTTTTRIRM